MGSLLCLLYRKLLWIFASNLPGDLALKMAGIFGEFSVGSVSQETKHNKSSKHSAKLRSNIRDRIRDENSKNPGKFRCATFLT